ncbi:MAG: hypothetical protein ACP5OE_10075, partial [Thermodesulfobium sp.]
MPYPAQTRLENHNRIEVEAAISVWSWRWKEISKRKPKDLIFHSYTTKVENVCSQWSENFPDFDSSLKSTDFGYVTPTTISVRSSQ